VIVLDIKQRREQARLRMGAWRVDLLCIRFQQLFK
jgi:hypothetical protein